MGSRARRALVLALVAFCNTLALSWALAAARAPAQDAGVVAAPPIPGLAEKMGRRVLSSLRELHHAMPHVLAAQHATQPDGSEDLALLYEYADYDACVGAAPSKAEGRARCRDRLGLSASCTHREVVHATIGPTPRARAPGTGGAITVIGSREEPGDCLVDSVLAFDRSDVDDDGRMEIVVDLVTISHPADFRTGSPMDVRTRALSILREDATPQFGETIAGWGTANASAAEDGDRASRWSLVDADHDGHRDLRMESFEYTGPCDVDAGGWFQPDDPEEEVMCAGVVAVTNRTYDASADAYR